MTTKLSKTTLLSEDILRTANDLHGKLLDLNTLCCDHNNPALLGDQKPVFSITRDQLVDIFDYNMDHYCLSPQQVLRFGEYCRLDLPDIISLMTKAEWESLISMVIKNSSADTPLNLASALRNNKVTDKFIRNFRPDSGKFYSLIRDTVQSEYEIRYSVVDFLISELLEENRFLQGPGQTGIHYSDRANNELIVLSEADESQREEYKESKQRWIEKSTELEDYLYLLEQKKRYNLNTEDKYFSQFWKEESIKANLVHRIEKLRIVLSIMKERPGLTCRELLTEAEERLQNADIKKSEIRKRITRSQNCIYLDNVGIRDSYITEDLKNRYTKAVKSLLRKIWFLCHPDTSPGYSNLSDETKKEIDALWLRTMSKTKEEQHSYSPEMLLYHLPDMAQLETVYFKICRILNINPDHYETGNRLEFMISTGATITELIEFLRHEIAKISLQLTNLELVQDEYTNDIQAQKYRQANDNISKHTDKLKKEISELRSSLQMLKNEIINEFKNAN